MEDIAPKLGSARNFLGPAESGARSLSSELEPPEPSDIVSGKVTLRCSARAPGVGVPRAGPGRGEARLWAGGGEVKGGWFWRLPFLSLKGQPLET